MAALCRVLVAALPESVDPSTAPFTLIHYPPVAQAEEAPAVAAAGATAPVPPPSVDTSVGYRTVVTGCEALRAFVTNHRSSFHSPAGVLHFVYSVLLTRGLDVVRADMDDASLPLVGRFGHCGQELVNLMLIGRAVTNVHDGVKVMPGGDPHDVDGPFRLRGIPRAGHVGFLTLLELLRYCKVGMHYKAPQHPLWVVGSTGHYSVVFGLQPTLGALSASEARLHAAKVAFQTLDPEETGFVASDQLPALQRSLPALAQASAAQLADALDDGARGGGSLLRPSFPSLCPVCVDRFQSGALRRRRLVGAAA